jgi:hypothetical protein
VLLAELPLLVQLSQVFPTVGVALCPFLFARGGVQLLKPGDINVREDLSGQQQGPVSGFDGSVRRFRMKPG